MKTRIGILGGTFNPVHIGHLILAQDAMQAFELAKVLFVPCNKPSHKATSLVPAAHRVAMLTRALAGNPSFEISDIDIRRGGITYSVDTVRALTHQHPKHELVFIIGSDTLPELHQWNAIGELLNLCRFATMMRPGFEMNTVTEKDLRLDPPWPRRLLKNVATGHRVDISSSDIRYRIAKSMSIRYLVPLDVETYIAEHRLYGMV